jgi:phosphoglycerol transferase MdoB-like AlkP superfamily enzyme
MSARELMREVDRRNRVLARTGWLHVALLVLFVILAFLDGRTVTGVSPWLKPAKFAVSIAVYTFTLAWLMPYLSHYRRAVKFISWGTAVVFVGEMICIISQAARGVPSHFNISTAYDASVFATMGLLIIFNTLLVLVALVLFCGRTAPLPAAYLWGIRVGLCLFFVASVEGYAMVSNMAHTVGLPDGGAGLPVVNWSTRAGDLRVAHFLGFHALQILPLAGYSFSRWHTEVVRRRAVAYVLALGLAYFAVFSLLFWQASAGRPLLAWN